MSDENEQQLFDADDIEILRKLFLLFPDLEIIAYATKLARSKIVYPLEKHGDFLPLFDDASRTFIFKGHKITFKQLEQFLPQEFLPIENEDEFIRRCLIALTLGRNSHFGHQIEPTQYVMIESQQD